MRVCFCQIQKLICLPPLLSVLTVQSCRLNDINQAKSESRDLEWRPDEALVMSAYTNAVSMSPGVCGAEVCVYG